MKNIQLPPLLENASFLQAQIWGFRDEKAVGPKGWQ